MRLHPFVFLLFLGIACSHAPLGFAGPPTQRPEMPVAKPAGSPWPRVIATGYSEPKEGVLPVLPALTPDRMPHRSDSRPSSRRLGAPSAIPGGRPLPVPAAPRNPSPPTRRSPIPPTPENPIPPTSDSLTPWTLDDLTRIALRWNPTLVQADMAVKASRGDWVQAGLRPNPTIGYAGEDIGIDGTAGQQGLVFGHEMFLTDKLGPRRAVVSHEVQQARHEREAQRQRVLNDVRTRYYEVLLTQKSIALHEQLTRIEDEAVDLAEKLRIALEASQLDVLQAHVEAQATKLSLAEAKSRHRTAWRRLAVLLGQPELEPRPLLGTVDADFPEFVRDETLAKLLAESPQLAKARAGVSRARHEVTRQCAERIGNLDVEVGVKYDTAARGTLVDLGVSLPLPLYDRNQGNILRAEAERVAAENEVRRVEFSLRERFAEVFEQYANARERVDIYAREILPNAQKSLNMVTNGYRQGEFGYLPMLTAQRTYLSKSLEFHASLSELWIRGVELEGMLLTGGLQPLE